MEGGPAAEGRRGLLAPGVPWLPLLRTDLLVMAGLYLAAWAVRFPILDSHPYTAEAAHFWIARHLWDASNNMYAIDGWHSEVPWLFWQRPLFSVLLWPGAAVSFDAYRTLHVAVTATIPALGYVLVRALGTGRSAAALGGSILCVHPHLVTWSVLVLPDGLMATATLAALVAAQAGRLRLTGLLLLAATWVKEVAILTPVVLLGWALWRDPDGVRTRWFPFRTGYWATTFAFVSALAFVPLLYSLAIGGAFPGWGRGGDASLVIERVWLTPWLAILPLLALAWPSTRRLGTVALAWCAFFLGYRLVLGRTVEAWYYLLPATLVVLAGAAALDASWRLAPRASVRKAVAAVAALAVVLVSAQVLLDDTVAAKRAITTPLSHNGSWSLRQALAFEEIREDDLHETLGSIPDGDDGGVWFTVDVDWSFVIHPISDRVDKVYLDYSSTHAMPGKLDLRRVAEVIEEEADVTLVKRIDAPLSQAILATYANCVAGGSDPYLVVHGKDCRGRAAALQAEFDARRGA